MPNRKTAMAVTAAALILASGCSRTDNEPGPGGVTVSEAKALDDAAEMLESRDGTATADQDATKK
ncbi:MAG: hypothetical protein ACREB7_02325 [Sphingopyxis sp.]|uniref:hypothetical protein n=1 Tax=Sphingopyxis sp. TaxID=1908224 RepID=UPI003D6CFC4D